MPTLPDLPLATPDLTGLTDLTGRPTKSLSSDLHNKKATHAGPPLDVGRVPVSGHTLHIGSHALPIAGLVPVPSAVANGPPAPVLVSCVLSLQDRTGVSAGSVMRIAQRSRHGPTVTSHACR